MSDWKIDLIKAAANGREKAYAPYSGYHVGAALLTKEGKVFTGCNVENASFGVTNCAERTAIFKAVSEGYLDFLAIAVVGGPLSVNIEVGAGSVAGADSMACADNMPGVETDRLEFPDYAFPCGVCRQVLQEFCSSDFEIIVAKSTEDYKIFTLSELLPYGFGGRNS